MSERKQQGKTESSRSECPLISHLALSRREKGAPHWSQPKAGKPWAARGLVTRSRREYNPILGMRRRSSGEEPREAGVRDGTQVIRTRRHRKAEQPLETMAAEATQNTRSAEAPPPPDSEQGVGNDVTRGGK